MAKRGFKVFDSDMHVMEPPDLWERYMPAEFTSRAPRGVTSSNVRDLRLMLPGMTPQNTSPPRGKNFHRNQLLYGDHARRGWGPDVQLEAMDAEGIDVAVLFPSRGLSALTQPDMDPGLANAIARAYNDWLCEFCQAAPDRLLGAGMISVYDIGHAVEEAHRVARELGFRTVFLRSNMVTGKPWHDPYYEPLWNALEELSLPLGFHEASGSWSRQIGELFEPVFPLRRIVAQPMEQMLALCAFITGGVLARHPRLRVAFLEANCSWVPWMVWRMDEAYETDGDTCMLDLTEAPSAYFRRQCYVSIEPDELPARHMLADFGSGQLVFSTDYPHIDSRYPKAVETFLDLPIADDDKRKILWDNCARFYAVEEGAGVT